MLLSHYTYLFSDDDCGKNLGASHGTIKSPNFPFPYPDYADCVWRIVLQKVMRIEFQFIAFNLSTTSQTNINYVTIKTNDYYDYTIDSYYKHSLPSSFTRRGQVFEVVFRTGQNKNRNYGFLLRYFQVEYAKISIASNDGAKAASLNATGMYAYSFILIFALQSSPYKKLQNSPNKKLKKILVKNFSGSCRFIYTC